MDVETFTEQCQKVYFPVDGYSMADFVSMHAALLIVVRNMTDYDFQQLKMKSQDIVATIILCQNNITSALEQLNLFLHPCTENIKALIMGVSHSFQRCCLEADHDIQAATALEDSRMSTAWRLTSIAARLCLDAGLHRLKEDAQDLQLNEKKRCFWHVYCFEKVLALNFGRTSTIQDFDIATSYPNSFPWLPNSRWHGLWNAFCDASRLLSRIYEKLYSVHGQQQDPKTKSELVESIAEEHMRLIEFCKVIFYLRLTQEHY